MLIGIYAVYTIGLGTKNATVFGVYVATFGVSHCKYTLIFHNRNKLFDFFDLIASCNLSVGFPNPCCHFLYVFSRGLVFRDYSSTDHH